MSYARPRPAAPPIPLVPSVRGWKHWPIHDCGEPLVALGPYSQQPDLRLIYTRSVYFGEGSSSPYRNDGLFPWQTPVKDIPGSLITMFVRERVAQMLLDAQAHLPPNCRLVIHDAYRPASVQRSLYDHYHGRLRELHPDWSAERLARQTEAMVSLPSDNPRLPAPHSTGGSVDLVIMYVPEERLSVLEQIEADLVRTEGDDLTVLELRRLRELNRWPALDFGVPFDFGGPQAALRYYERAKWRRRLTDSERRGLTTRRLLAFAMRRAGFHPYGPEFWHWNFGNQMAARSAWFPWAIYGPAELSEANFDHERRRQNLWSKHSQMAGVVWSTGGRDLGVHPLLGDGPGPDHLGNIDRISPPG